MITQFVYDVAFSFLGQDEQLAVRLNDLLKDRVTTFIYSDPERQKQLAGRDGDLMFNRVFGKEARTVVVLYRDGWGARGFTAVEATAIRNRAYEEGPDFTMFIPLDKPPSGPPWLPRNRLWIGLDRWGIESAVAVIESRVQEVGGTPKAETAEEMAARTVQQLRIASERAAFLDSPRGLQAEYDELGKLFEELQRICANSSGLLVEPERHPNVVALRGGHFKVTIRLKQGWAETTHDSELQVSEWEGAAWGLHYPEMGQPLLTTTFAFDYRNGEVGWRLKSGNQDFYSTTRLADRVAKQLLNRIMKS